MTSVTFKIRSRSPSLNLVFVLTWCFCIPNLVRINRTLIQILSRNHLSHAVTLNDLENRVKVTWFEVSLCLALLNLCTKLGEDTSNISSDIEGKPSFKWHCLKYEVKVTRSNLVIDMPWCLCVPNLVRIHQKFLQILSSNHLSYVVALNDLCDHENKVKVTQFKPCLCLALVLLCTTFSEKMSIIASDIERKPFFICHRLK